MCLCSLAGTIQTLLIACIWYADDKSSCQVTLSPAIANLVGNVVSMSAKNHWLVGLFGFLVDSMICWNDYI